MGRHPKPKKNNEESGVMIPKVEKPLPPIPEESVSNGKAAVTTFTDRAQAFMIMDKRDDIQIIDALQGQFSEEFIYDIPFKAEYGKCNCKATDGPHNHVRGLSVTGIREACRLYGAIQCQVGQPQLIEEAGIQYYETWGEATDLRTGISEKKWYRVPLIKALKGGKTKDDPYAYQICQSKAERNAKSVLLPQELIRAWLQDYKSGKKGLNPAPARAMREKQKELLPPPETKNSNDNNREQALGAILEKLKGLGVDEKYQDQLLCKIAEHLGHEPIPKKLKDIDSIKLPVIQQWLFQVGKQIKLEKPTGREVELSDFSSLLSEVEKGK